MSVRGIWYYNEWGQWLIQVIEEDTHFKEEIQIIKNAKTDQC